MTNAEELAALADEVVTFNPALALRMRAIAARVRRQERCLDEIAEEGRLSARLAESVAVEHLSVYRRRRAR